MAKLMELQGGGYTLVDDDVYEWAKDTPWYKSPYGYIMGWVEVCGQQMQVKLHRLIMNAAEGVLIDHRDRDQANNTRQNLRPCSSGQNHANCCKRTKGSSRYKGVSWHKRLQKWRAIIAGKQIGLFDNEDEAAQAYNEAAKEKWGEFALLNRIGEDWETTPIHKAPPRPFKLKVRYNPSGYRGVSSSKNRWQARMRYQKKDIYMGTFDTREEAARAYDAKARELFGDAAILNFPEVP